MVRPTLCFAALLALAIGCNQSAPSTPTERAEIEVRKGNYGTAIEVTNEALALNPSDAQAHLVRGRAHHYRNQQGDVELAIADFTEAIRLAPNDSSAYYSRSMAYRDQGDADASKADEGKARELDPRVSETYSHLPEPPEPSIAPPPADESGPAAPEAADKATDSLKMRSDNYGEYLRLRRQFDSGAPRRAGASDGRENGPASDSLFAPRTKRGEANNDAQSKFGDNSGSSRAKGDRDTGTDLGTAPDDDSRSRRLEQLRNQAPNDQQAGPAPARPGQPGSRSKQVGPGSQRPSALRPETEMRSPVQNPFAGGVGNSGSPWQQRPAQFPTGTGAPAQTPFQSPFPQRAPRPTGFVEPRVPALPASPPQNTAPYVPPSDDFYP